MFIPQKLLFKTEFGGLNLTWLFLVEKERKKAEKLKKFSEKQAKTSSNATAPKGKGKPAKKESVKDVSLPEYIEETPPGEKKGMFDKKPLVIDEG